MSVPGFNAETSLYKTSIPYQIGPVIAESVRGPVVIPQGRYCCILTDTDPITGVAGVIGCENIRAWRPFAEIACSFLGLLGGYDAALARGRCRDRPQCG